MRKTTNRLDAYPVQSVRHAIRVALVARPLRRVQPDAYEDACDKEVEVGIDLQSAGFGVWQA